MILDNKTHRAARFLSALLFLAWTPLMAQEEKELAAVKAGMRRIQEPPPQGSSLVVAVRLKRTGEATVESVTELPGQSIVLDDPISDFFWAVTEGGKTVASQAFPDPFEGHSYGGTPPEHFFIPLEESTVVVQLPGRSLNGPLEGLELRFYHVKPGDSPVEKVDSRTIDALRRQNRLETLAALSGSRLATEARQKGIRADRDR